VKKIAIFGANGYLGAQLAFYLKTKGEICDEFDVPECDITDSGWWDSFDPTQYKSILFFAGLTGTENSFCNATKYVMVNEIGLLNLLSKLAPMGDLAPKIVFPSSRLVYKGADHALSEDDEKEAKTVYAANKLACERYLMAYHNRYGLPFAVIRICVPYGNLISSDYSYGTLGFFLKQAATGKITLYGTGEQRRSFTHVADICEIVRLFSMNSIFGVFNIGGSNLSLFEAAQIVAKRKGAEVKLLPWPKIDQALETGSTYFSAERLAQAIGFTHYRLFEHITEEL